MGRKILAALLNNSVYITSAIAIALQLDIPVKYERRIQSSLLTPQNARTGRGVRTKFMDISTGTRGPLRCCKGGTYVNNMARCIWSRQGTRKEGTYKVSIAHISHVKKARHKEVAYKVFSQPSTTNQGKAQGKR